MTVIDVLRALGSCSTMDILSCMCAASQSLPMMKAQLKHCAARLLDGASRVHSKHTYCM